VKTTFNEWFAAGEIVDADDIAYMSYEEVKSWFNVAEYNDCMPSTNYQVSSDHVGSCICSHWIVSHCIIQNQSTGKWLFVGTECIKRFGTKQLNEGTAEELSHIADKMHEFKYMCEHPNQSFRNIFTPKTIAYMQKYKVIDDKTLDKIAQIGCGNTACTQFYMMCSLDDIELIVYNVFKASQKITCSQVVSYNEHDVVTKTVLENTNIDMIQEWFQREECAYAININRIVNTHVKCMYHYGHQDIQ
jgi:hypothetical protein